MWNIENMWVRERETNIHMIRWLNKNDLIHIEEITSDTKANFVQAQSSSVDSTVRKLL